MLHASCEAGGGCRGIPVGAVLVDQEGRILDLRRRPPAPRGIRRLVICAGCCFETRAQGGDIRRGIARTESRSPAPAQPQGRPTRRGRGLCFRQEQEHNHAMGAAQQLGRAGRLARDFPRLPSSRVNGSQVSSRVTRTVQSGSSTGARTSVPHGLRTRAKSET